MSTKVIVSQPPAFVAKVVAPGQFKVTATGIAFNMGDNAGVVSWDDITGKPTEFTAEAHEHGIDEIAGLEDELAGKAENSHTHEVSDVVNLATYLAAKADLVDGVIPTSQIPAQAVSEFLGDVASQAAMLALTGQRGDWCIRTDVNRTYFIISEPASNLANWRYIETPASPVVSVNGQTGVIVLGKTDLGLGNVDNTSDANKPVSSAQQTALNSKANSSHNHSGNDLTLNSGSTNADITGVFYGNGSKISAATPTQVQAAVKNALGNTARLALSGGSLTDGLIVYDIDWQCDFRYNSTGAYWQQLNRPRHTYTVALTLPNPVVGYRVWLTDLNVEAIWQGFWQYSITIYKPTTSSYFATTPLLNDPHLTCAMQAGSWLIEAFIASNNPTGGVGFKHTFSLPTFLTGESWVSGTGSRIGSLTTGTTTVALTASTTTATSTVNTGSDAGGVMSARFVWRCGVDGTFIYQWAMGNTGSGTYSILAGSFIRLTKTA